jgi:acetoin utilization deacetylase AcuC-like enzyme
MLESYDNTPAGAPGRLDSAVQLLSSRPDYEFIEPQPATEEQILLAHDMSQIQSIKHESEVWHPKLYRMASLAAGGAILAAELAMQGKPTFGLIRPPGHHASYSSYWGFCYFNNVSVSLLNLKAKGLIESAFILDPDLHYGDGNVNILEGRDGFTIYNPKGHGDADYLADTKSALDNSPDVDIIVVSAGFDEYLDDWGGNLSTDAFQGIGRLVHSFAQERCEGRCYGLLEGGYNFEDLGKNILAFCEGLQGK